MVSVGDILLLIPQNIVPEFKLKGPFLTEAKSHLWFHDVSGVWVSHAGPDGWRLKNRDAG